MATGDGINKTSGAYVTVQAAASTLTNAVSAGAVTNITTAIPSSADYFLLDFQVVVSGTAPSLNGYLNIYKRQGGDQSAPTTSYKQKYVGSVTTAAATGNYYLRGVVNDDPSDTYYMESQLGDTCTIELKARTRTYAAAP